MTRSRPRIALCAHGIHDGGGMERAFAELIRHSSHRVEWIVVSSELQVDLRPLVTWKRIPSPATPAPLRFVLFWVLAGVRLAFLRRDALHTLGAITWPRAQVVTVQFCHEAFNHVKLPPARRVSALRAINTVVHRALALRAERFCFRPDRVGVFGAVSPGVQRELAEHYPGIPSRVTPNGVDTHRFRPEKQARNEVRAAEGSDAESVIAIFVGGEWARKGLAVAIRAVALAAARVETPLLLWVVGEGDAGSFRTLSHDLGIESQVAFLGRHADVERYLQAADIFVFPTSYETFSLASYEAAATGLPVLATPVSGIEDLIGADDAGISVQPEPEAVAAGLVRLVRDPGLRRRLGAAGRVRASEFSWERSANSVLETYALLLRRDLGGDLASQA